jgi:MFS family permease
MYDFMVFAYYAPNISKAFFPSHSAFLSLMLAFMTFGAGFLMRPLGAIVLGTYADTHGRRASLLLTLALMAVGTLSLACTPSYALVGLTGPVLVVLGRLIQGFSAGAELGTVSVYLSEIAPPDRKGFLVSWQSASQQCAVVFAALLGLALTATLSHEAMNDWGWRIPLFVGALIVPLVYLMRRSLPETHAFTGQAGRTASSLIGELISARRLILSSMLMVVMTTVSFYLITAYTPTFGRDELHLSSLDSFLVTLAVGATNLFWLLAVGAFSDRVGRRKLLIAFTVLAIVTAYPAVMWLAAAPSFGRLLAVELWLSFIYGSYNGAMVVYLTEIVPARIRASGFSLAYSLATALFGGFTPAICTYLIHRTGNLAAPGAWMSAAGVLGLVGVVTIRRPSAEG